MPGQLPTNETRPPAAEKAGEPQPLTVFYDGSCPMCSREIAVYQRLAARAPLCFLDISQASAPLPPGTNQAQLMARFHVRRAEGGVLAGADAFLALWAALPGWRWLARTGRLPGVARLMEWTYRGFLLARPTLQRWARRLELRATER